MVANNQHSRRSHSAQAQPQQSVGVDPSSRSSSSQQASQIGRGAVDDRDCNVDAGTFVHTTISTQGAFSACALNLPTSSKRVVGPQHPVATPISPCQSSSPFGSSSDGHISSNASRGPAGARAGGRRIFSRLGPQQPPPLRYNHLLPQIPYPSFSLPHPLSPPLPSHSAPHVYHSPHQLSPHGSSIFHPPPSPSATAHPPGKVTRRPLTRAQKRDLLFEASGGIGVNGQQPPRPPNSWILYRLHTLELIRQAKEAGRDFPFPKEMGDGEGLLKADVGKLIAHMWKNESKEIKDIFARQSLLRKAEVRQI